MTPLAREERLAALVLTLLLGEDLPTVALAAVDWNLLADLAEQNAVLVRLADRLADCGIHPPRRLAEAAERERERARIALGVLELIAAAAARHGVPWILTKARDRLPDVGDDLDLLVGADADAADRWLLEGVAVNRHEPTLAHRLAGSTLYTVTGTSLVLDIRHGRLGHAGQHADYATQLFRNQRCVTLGGVTCAVPAPEDQLVLAGVEKVTARRTFHLCDVLHAIGTIRQRRAHIDWDYVVATARTLGIRGALSCYLHYVDDIYARLVGAGAGLLDPATRRVLGPPPRGLARRAEFGRAGFRFPALWLTGRVHAQQLVRKLVARDWTGANRLAIWPFAAVAARLDGRATSVAPAPRPAWPEPAEAQMP